MPRHDDSGIPGECVLIRAVDPEWIFPDQNGERLTSATFLDGHQEASCFIADEIGGIEGFLRDILPILSQDLEKILRAATVTANQVRAHQLWIYRKPEEFRGNPAHVVVCSSDGMSKSQYKKAARRLSEDAVLLSIL